MINIYDLYQPNVTAPNADYPYGAVRDDSSESATDGTPIRQAFLNDINGFFQAMLHGAGIVPNGNAETVQTSQLRQALQVLTDARVNALVPAATTLIAGKSRFATDAEVISGSAANRAVTPAGLSARTATESRSGISRYATATEALAGTITDAAVTPAGVLGAIRGAQASETLRGTAALATVIETLARSSADRTPYKTITPKSLYDACLGYTGTDGWIDFPGGWRVCYGTATSTSSSFTGTYPAFSGNVLGGWCTAYGSVRAASSILTATSNTVTGAVWDIQSGYSSAFIKWFVLGRMTA